MQHPFFWNGVFVFWCCRDDLSFFRKGVAKICRATASLFLHAVWASFVYPSINTRRAYDCGGSFFGCTGAGWQWTGLGLIFSFKICPEETPRQWWFSPKKIHMESPNEGSRQPFVLFFLDERILKWFRKLRQILAAKKLWSDLFLVFQASSAPVILGMFNRSW